MGLLVDRGVGERGISGDEGCNGCDEVEIGPYEPLRSTLLRTIGSLGGGVDRLTFRVFSAESRESLP